MEVLVVALLTVATPDRRPYRLDDHDLTTVHVRSFRGWVQPPGNLSTRRLVVDRELLLIGSARWPTPSTHAISSDGTSRACGTSPRAASRRCGSGRRRTSAGSCPGPRALPASTGSTSTPGSSAA